MDSGSVVGANKEAILPASPGTLSAADHPWRQMVSAGGVGGCLYLVGIKRGYVE
jgi:hypothetical protein